MPGRSRPIYPGDRRRQRPEGEVVAQAQAVFPAGRATSVPFTAVMTGPQRTPTDNTSAASPGPFPDRGAAGRADRASLGGESEGHPWRQCHREGTCEFGLSIHVTQPGKQTLLPIACTSGCCRLGRLRLAKGRWPGFPTNTRSTVQTLPPCLHGPRRPHHPIAPTRCTRWFTVTVPPGLSGWRAPTQRLRAVMSDSCPPSSFAITSVDGLGQGSALPCPAGRSVPGRGGPERRRRPRPDGTGPRSVLGPLRTGPQGHERSPTVINGQEEPQVGWSAAQPARTTAGSGSDCGPEGRGFESPRPP
jgi:hypothetical protein